MTEPGTVHTHSGSRGETESTGGSPVKDEKRHPHTFRSERHTRGDCDYLLPYSNGRSPLLSGRRDESVKTVVESPFELHGIMSEVEG